MPYYPTVIFTALFLFSQLFLVCAVMFILFEPNDYTPPPNRPLPPTIQHIHFKAPYKPRRRRSKLAGYRANKALINIIKG